MNFTRRGCIAALGVGIAAHGSVVGSVSASSRVSVTGFVESADGIPIDGSTVELFSHDSHQHKNAAIEDGTFEVSIPAGEAYDFRFWHETPTGDYRTDFDGVPLFYDLEETLQIDEDTDLGTYELPEAHEVQLRFEDMDGNPVRDLHVGFRLPSGSGTGPQRFFTNADGYVYHGDPEATGIELAGDVSVELQSPTDHTDFITTQRLAITEDREVMIPVQDPEEYGGRVVADGSDPEETVGTDLEGAGGSEESGPDDTEASGGDTAEGERARGFFTNDPDSSFAFLDDPVAITWGGIVVSIVGITMQLVGSDS